MLGVDKAAKAFPSVRDKKLMFISKSGVTETDKRREKEAIQNLAELVDGFHGDIAIVTQITH